MAPRSSCTWGQHAYLWGKLQFYPAAVFCLWANGWSVRVSLTLVFMSLRKKPYDALLLNAFCFSCSCVHLSCV